MAQDCTPGKWTVGDRVMALLPGGGNAEIVSVHEDHLMPLPKTMTFREAAAIPEVSRTRIREAAAIPEVSRTRVREAAAIPEVIRTRVRENVAI